MKRGLFSQRQGIRPASKIIQKAGMDEDLRTGLWNAFYVCYAKKFNGRDRVSFIGSNLENLFCAYGHSLFKLRLDGTNFASVLMVLKMLRTKFSHMKWFDVYDFIEFTIKEGPTEFADDFRKMCNDVLERENSAYRIVSFEVTPITSSQEIQSIEDAIEKAGELPGPATHLNQALCLMSDRNSPDYRNSIKESVSAVESLCQIVAEDPKAAFGKALGILAKRIDLHPALKSAFNKLYSYASEEDGIRHAMLEIPDLSDSDARFMLVACSAFVNYVVAKCGEKGLAIQGASSQEKK